MSTVTIEEAQAKVSESVREVYEGLQSLRTIKRIEAR